MTLKSWIRKRVKEGTFSREPHPIVPFILFVMILAAWMIAYMNYYMPRYFTWIMFGLVGLTLVFAILHLYVWSVAKGMEKKK